MFRNHYECPDCGGEWTDVWSAACDDDCPHCGTRHVTPLRSESLLSARIAGLNDAFRRTFAGGHVLITSGVQALASDVRAIAIRRVATFADFTGDNDPRGEHDFGSFDLAGRRFLWKIDYYDENLRFGSEDPADLAKTTRVLTIMLGEEY